MTVLSVQIVLFRQETDQFFLRNREGKWGFPGRDYDHSESETVADFIRDSLRRNNMIHGSVQRPSRYLTAHNGKKQTLQMLVFLDENFAYENSKSFSVETWRAFTAEELLHVCEEPLDNGVAEAVELFHQYVLIEYGKPSNFDQ